MALHLEITTPSQRALQVECDEVRLPGAEGSFGVLPGHTPLLSLLQPGALYFRGPSGEQTYALGEGFAEVSNDKVRVLVEEAERADQIDLAAAQKQLEERKAQLLALKPEDTTREIVQMAVDSAAARVAVASKK
jgi:F-type H+-transporting ATPase subunit epsilon